MEIANLYDNGPISPIAKIKDNLTVWTNNRWSYFQVLFIEPIPQSSPLTIDMVTQSGATILPAAGIIQKNIVTALQISDNELLHLRWEPIDDCEGVLWEQAGTARFATKSVQARVGPFTSQRDPFLATTTFYIIGLDRNMSLEVRNLNAAYAMPKARFAFFGFRYLLKVLESEPQYSTYLPAEGRGA